MKSKISKTSDPYRLLLNLTDKIDLRRKDKYLYQILAFTIHGKILYSNNKFRISALSWNEKFELPDGSYSISDIQDYFEYILKSHGEKTVNPSIRIYANKIENRITVKLKTGYYFEF